MTQLLDNSLIFWNLQGKASSQAMTSNPTLGTTLMGSTQSQAADIPKSQVLLKKEGEWTGPSLGWGIYVCRALAGKKILLSNLEISCPDSFSSTCSCKESFQLNSNFLRCSLPFKTTSKASEASVTFWRFLKVFHADAEAPPTLQYHTHSAFPQKNQLVFEAFLIYLGK